MAQLRASAKQAEEIARTEEFIRRYGAGQRSKEARGRGKKLARLRAHRSTDRSRRVTAGGSKPRDLGSETVLETTALAVGYGDPVMRTGPLRVPRDARVAVVGPNGAGKTTLVRTLVGDLTALDGYVSAAPAARVAYLEQAQAELTGDQTVLDAMRAAGARDDQEARNLLARFLFRGDDVTKSVGGPLRRRAKPTRAGATLAAARESPGARRADESSRPRGPRAARGGADRLRGHADLRLARPLLHRQARDRALADLGRPAPPLRGGLDRLPARARSGPRRAGRRVVQRQRRPGGCAASGIPAPESGRGPAGRVRRARASGGEAELARAGPRAPAGPARPPRQRSPRRSGASAARARSRCASRRWSCSSGS